jgi:hypothetical protein
MTGPDGVFHVHNRRTCWDCNGVGQVGGAISLRVTEKVLYSIGWRFLADTNDELSRERTIRMVCPDCALIRRQGFRQVRLGDW